MTATHVNGVAVVATEPAVSTWKDRKGNPVQYRQMLRLLLADGTEVYGCLHCDYTHPNLNSVRPHLNAHRAQKRVEEETADSVGVRALVAKLAAADRLAADRDHWKARALKAEGDLASLRRAFRRAGVPA